MSVLAPCHLCQKVPARDLEAGPIVLGLLLLCVSRGPGWSYTGYLIKQKSYHIMSKKPLNEREYSLCKHPTIIF